MIIVGPFQQSYLICSVWFCSILFYSTLFYSILFKNSISFHIVFCFFSSGSGDGLQSSFSEFLISIVYCLPVPQLLATTPLTHWRPIAKQKRCCLASNGQHKHPHIAKRCVLRRFPSNSLHDLMGHLLGSKQCSSAFPKDVVLQSSGKGCPLFNVFCWENPMSRLLHSWFLADFLCIQKGIFLYSVPRIQILQHIRILLRNSSMSLLNGAEHLRLRRLMAGVATIWKKSWDKILIGKSLVPTRILTVRKCLCLSSVKIPLSRNWCWEILLWCWTKF